MPINAECPECHNRYRLQDGMLGKSMRCPTCQEVFVVRDLATPASVPAEPKEKAPPPPVPARPRSDAPPVTSRTGNVGDFVPVIQDVASASPPKPAPKPKDAPKSGFPWDQPAKPKSKAVAGPPAPKEITWSPDLADPLAAVVPLAPVPASAQYEEAEESQYEDPADDEPYAVPDSQAPVTQKKRRGFKLLVGILSVVFVIIGIGAYLGIQYLNLAPERYFKQAEEDYTAQNFRQAKFHFDKIVNEHKSHRLVPKARFFSELSSLREQVGLLQTRDDPRAAIAEWGRFLKAIEDPDLAPFAAKDQFGLDIFQAGVKLAEDTIAKGHNSFNPDDPTEAEGWLKQAIAVHGSLEQFRQADADKPEHVQKDIVALQGKIETARDRVNKLAELKKVLGEGNDDQVEAAKRLAAALGLDRDPAFAGLLEEAEAALEAKIVYLKEPHPIPPIPAPDDGLTSLLFAPRFDRNERRPLEGPGTVFFCLARGVLYALAEDDGHVLWAARTGLDTDIMPVRIRPTDERGEMVLVASNTGDQFGITARGARDGRPIWHHRLSHPCRGTPAIVGSHVYVSLADPEGTVLEVLIATGEIVGRFRIGRPLGPVMAARPGTGLIYIPAESQAVYVVDTDQRGINQERLDPKVLGVMRTGHPGGSLRGVPVFSNPDPRDPGPRYFVLGQAERIDAMKIRAFRLPETPDGKPDGSATAAEIALPGWASFPPYCDGEKLAVVTDKGEFGLYGLGLEGNKDAALFAFQTRQAKPDDNRPSRGQIVLAEEGAFWILAGGELRRLRFGINNTDGVRLVPYGDPIVAGEPLHAPQVNARGDTFVVVTQEGMTCRATAVDPLTGQMRWRRELGMIAKGDPLPVGDHILMLDQGGGFYRVDPTKLAAGSPAAWLVDERWMISPPARGFTPLTGLIPGPNGSALAVLAGENEKGEPSILIRVCRGAAVEEQMYPTLARLAGRPVISGGFLILPLTNGNLARVRIDGGKRLEEGPSWRAERLLASAVCYIAVLNNSELYATDGARSIIRWQWDTETFRFSSEGRLQVPSRIAANPVILPGSPNRLVIADANGNLTVWDGDKLTGPILKAWRSEENPKVPSGPITDGLRLLTTPDGKPRIVYESGGRLVWLSPDAPAPEWIGPEPVQGAEGRPLIAGGRILLTDRAGLVRAANAQNGQLMGDEFRLTGSHAFAAAAVPVNGQRILAPLADGTVVLGELKPAPKPEPKKEKAKVDPKKEPKAKEEPKARMPEPKKSS